MLDEEGEAATIVVSDNFHDPEGQALTYSVAVEPEEGIVDAELAANEAGDTVLTITPVAEGPATITVTATDPDELATSATIKVTVHPEGLVPPETVGTIDPVTLDIGEIHTIQDIGQFFNETEDETLAYHAA